MSTVGDELPREMARVRDHVLPHYTPEVNGQLAAMMMRSALDRAARSMAEGDVVAMIQCLEELRGFQL